MSDGRWMRRAVELAAQGRGRTAPNPMVGAVIVAPGPDGVDRVLAEGWHRAPGQAHAEVAALDALPPGSDLSQATMYVNLEPCCHHGRTPPCTDALLAAGLRRVVVGMVDPDERVSGRGIEILRRNGVMVDVRDDEDSCRRLNAAYLRARESGRPQVTLKAGITLDGRIADAVGDSRWITGVEARLVAHRLRDWHDAVLVGAGTLLHDDPALDTRLSDGRDALPVVLDTHLRCPADARVLHAGRRALIFCGPDARARELDADVVAVPLDESGRVSLAAVLQTLLARGVHAVLVEGGGEVHRSFLDSGLVDRIELFVAPKLLVGGPGWVGGAPYPLALAPGFRVVGVRQVGDDLHVSLEP